MKIIEHESFVNLYNKDQKTFEKLFNNVGTISTLTNRINRLSGIYPVHGYPDEDKMKGDLFEIFAEIFFKVLSSDNRIGVYNYKPVSSGNDNGVDGYGIGMNNKPLTVQVKFRTDNRTELKENDLKQFGMQSIIKYGVDSETTSNMLVFTNAAGLHWYTERNVFENRLTAIGYDKIRKLINGNIVFWKDCLDMVDETIKVRYEKNDETVA